MFNVDKKHNVSSAPLKEALEILIYQTSNLWLAGNVKLIMRPKPIILARTKAFTRINN